MKRLCIIIAVLLVMLAQAVFAADIKFVQVTDSHYSKSNQYSEKLLRATIEDINTLQNVSFVVFTGDNINRPSIEDLAEFVRIANKLNVPYYMVIGNHEVFKSNGLSKVQYIETVREHNFMYKPKKPDYFFKKGEFGFIIADGAKEVIPGSNGYFKPSTLKFIDKTLAKHKKLKFVILQHFPIVEPQEIKSHQTYKSEEYLEMLNKHSNVIAVVSGHYHVNNEKMQNGVYHISSPSLLKLPHQYKIIDINLTKGFSPMIYTQLREVSVQ